MDAATLFMILTFPGGGVDTATREYQSLAECESEARRYRALGSPAPNITSDAYCVKHLRVSSVVAVPPRAAGLQEPDRVLLQGTRHHRATVNT
jgi:hypothetical protein